MKRFLMLFFIFSLSGNMTFSAPNYDTNIKPVIYDDTYDRELHKYLDSEYNKKCHVQISPTVGENICGVNSYGDMVAQVYIELAKTYEEMDLSNDSKKSKEQLLKEIKEDLAYYNELEEKYKNTCEPKYELYKQKVNELKSKGLFWFSIKEKLANEMIANGTLCSITTHDDMVYIPFHAKRMMKLKSKK